MLIGLQKPCLFPFFLVMLCTYILIVWIHAGTWICATCVQECIEYVAAGEFCFLDYVDDGVL